ncbi:hypothetical protein MAR_036060 [Mya arenaria]|uniref:Secreted protein n=1 Tax=Mya arenaria TaxID=6604 RepID=A0ABY7ERE5_MYAAR|nr:hypothetical protein MAR_036060 [Mya arenaria]
MLRLMCLLICMVILRFEWCKVHETGQSQGFNEFYTAYECHSFSYQLYDESPGPSCSHKALFLGTPSYTGCIESVIIMLKDFPTLGYTFQKSVY